MRQTAVYFHFSRKFFFQNCILLVLLRIWFDIIELVERYRYIFLRVFARTATDKSPVIIFRRSLSFLEMFGRATISSISTLLFFFPQLCLLKKGIYIVFGTKKRRDFYTDIMAIKEKELTIDNDESFQHAITDYHCYLII